MSNTELAFSVMITLIPTAYLFGVTIGSGAGRQNAEEFRCDLLREEERAEQYRAALQAVEACSTDELAASIARNALTRNDRPDEKQS